MLSPIKGKMRRLRHGLKKEQHKQRGCLPGNGAYSQENDDMQSINHIYLGRLCISSTQNHTAEIS